MLILNIVCAIDIHPYVKPYTTPFAISYFVAKRAMYYLMRTPKRPLDIPKLSSFPSNIVTKKGTKMGQHSHENVSSLISIGILQSPLNFFFWECTLGCRTWWIEELATSKGRLHLLLNGRCLLLLENHQSSVEEFQYLPYRSTPPLRNYTRLPCTDAHAIQT